MDGYGEPAGSGWLRLQSLRYDRVIVPLDDGTCYWHLFLCGERINGGLGQNPAEASSAAWYAMVQHIYLRKSCPDLS